jgi:hypothetical protein
MKKLEMRSSGTPVMLMARYLDLRSIHCGRHHALIILHEHTELGWYCWLWDEEMGIVIVVVRIRECNQAIETMRIDQREEYEKNG